MNILLIDDHPVIAEGIETRVHKVFPNANCFFVSTAREAKSKIDTHSFKLILCDLRLKDEVHVDSCDDLNELYGGFLIADYLKHKKSKSKIIAYTEYDSYRIMNRATNDKGREGKFHSFIHKGCDFEEFEQTLVQVLEVGNYESLTMKELKRKREVHLKTLYSESLHGISGLGSKELIFLLLISEYKDNKVIARRMDVKEVTLKTYFTRTMNKLCLNNRAELMLFSFEFKNEILKYLKK